jgi:hypothetical protein
MGRVAVPVSTPDGGRTPYLERAITTLAAWPALTMTHTLNAVVFSVAATDILRLTGQDTAHLRLTLPIAERLHDAFHRSGHNHTVTRQGWITLHLSTVTDLELLLALVSLAIKANTDSE